MRNLQADGATKARKKGSPEASSILILLLQPWKPTITLKAAYLKGRIIGRRLLLYKSALNFE